MFFLYKGDAMATVEVDKPKLVRVTAQLARKFRDMKRYPRDRDMTMTRLQWIKEIIRAGEYRGSEWVQATCMADAEVYRLNGRHSSTACCDLMEEGVKVEATVLVREYACDTMEDMARLYASFDPRQSSRTKGDIIKGFSAVSPELCDIPGPSLNIIAAGLAYNLWEQNVSFHKPEEQAMLLLQYPEFTVWVADAIKDGHKHKHIRRVPVVAAMARTWFKNKEAAKEFWLKIKDDCDDPKNTGPRVLRTWLLTHGLGAEKHGVRGTMANSDRREMFCRSITGWNAWRRSESTALKYHPAAKIPEAA